MKGNLGSEWEVLPSEGPGDGEAAAVHKEIYGARSQCAAPGGKKILKGIHPGKGHWEHGRSARMGKRGYM